MTRARAAFGYVFLMFLLVEYIGGLLPPEVVSP